MVYSMSYGNGVPYNILLLHYVSLHILYNIILQCIQLYCIALFCISLHCIIFRCIALYYIAVHGVMILLCILSIRKNRSIKHHSGNKLELTRQSTNINYLIHKIKIHHIFN